jgi:hypothetical protein
VATLLLLGSGGCYKAVTEVSEYSPYTGQDHLTIRGAAPGQTETDVVALFGPPDRRLDSGYRVVSLQWQRFGDMVVTLGPAGRVTEVLGNELTAGEGSVLQPGMSEADVRQVLGKPAKDQSQFQPSGSGVISLGHKRVGRTLWYHRDGRTIEVTLREDRLAYLRLTNP